MQSRLELIQRFLDPADLLTNAEIEHLFPPDDLTRNPKVTEREKAEMEDCWAAYRYVLGEMLGNTMEQVDRQTNTNMMGKFVLDLITGDNGFLGTRPQYEFWNVEVVSRLATHILRYHKLWKKPRTLVVEVGAGDGRLTHHLKRFTYGEPEAPTSGTPEATCQASDRRERDDR